MRKSKYVFVADDSITLRTERVVANKIDFNEVLSVLYREGQKMTAANEQVSDQSLLA
jgi:hypothetical protein